jgi:penicillin-binding protein 2
MEPRYRLRLYLLTALVLIGFGVLLSRLHDFQIERQEHFSSKVPGNREVTVREPGIRGEITDRNGIALARNVRNYQVSLDLEEIHRAYRLEHKDTPQLTRLTSSDGLPREATERDIVTIVNDSIIRRLEEEDLRLARSFNAKALRVHYLTHGGLVPFSYRADLTYDEFARFAEHNLELPGVYLSTRPLREYPYGTLASHILGYVKPWDKQDNPQEATRRFDHYVGDERGVGGVESTMDAILRGPGGKRTLIKNEKGRIIGSQDWDYTKPGVGAKVELTIDARVQYLVENVLRRAGRAAAVVMEVQTGEVLAMASVPDYNPNDFIPSITQARWSYYEDRVDMAPFTNRALEAYAPGSTFKIPTALSASIVGMANRSHSCSGVVFYGNTPVRCWIQQKGGRHGSLDLTRAIQQSCNPYFNIMANSIGGQAMVEGFQLLGFGRPTGVELPTERAGNLPGSRAWRNAKPGAAMTPHTIAMLSIGQGEAMATPLQLCAMVSAVANGGKYYKPRIVKRAVAADGSIVIADQPKLEVDLIRSGVKPEDLELVRKGMWMAANQAGGTAGRVRLTGLGKDKKIEISAKTGTAQTIDNGKPSHNSWLIAYAPSDDPKFAVCVLVQHAGSGGAVCGPLANLIFRGLFAQEDGLTLPLQVQTEYVGHTEKIEAIELPADVMAAINASEFEEDLGETGDEAGDLTPDIPTSPEPAALPTPAITPEVDEEGSIAPRAIPVPEP